MLLNATHSNGGDALRTVPNWQRLTENGNLKNTPPPMIILLIIALSLYSFVGRAENTSTPPFLTSSPIALDDQFVGVEDTPMTLVGITANDIDDDGAIDIETIDIDPVTNGQQTAISNAHGTYSLTVASGEIMFVPTNDWNGTTSLAYTVQDDEGNTSNIAYMYITITASIDAPTAMDDYASGFEDDPFINISMVHNNDFDPEGQGFLVGSIDINPITLDQDTYYEDTNGSWMVDLGYGTITFFPNANFHGTAMIGYTIVGFTNMLSNVALVYVDVLPTNDAPIAEPNQVVINSGLIGVLPNIAANDMDLENNVQVNTIDLEPTIAGFQTSTTTAHGSWTVDLNTADVTFTANGGYSGTTSIVYAISDSLGLISNHAALTAHVISTNNAPFAASDASNGLEDAVYINVPSIADNDSDPDGDEQLVISTIDLDQSTSGQQNAITTAQGDWTVDNNTGTVTYVPVANFSGIADIWYTIKDIGGLESNPGHILVTVNSDDDNPIAGLDSATTNMNVVCFIEDILDNDFDLEDGIDSSTVDLDLINAGIQYTYTNDFGQWDYIIADEKVQYTPATNFLGQAVHEYSVQDLNGTRSLPAALVVDVEAAIPPNATPIPNQSQFATVSSLTNTHILSDSWSSTWVDLNGDGWEDLFVNDKASENGNYVFQNMSGIGFEQLDATPFNASLTTVGSLWGDYDNDGDNDAILINDGMVPCHLYKNNGNGSFQMVTNSGLNPAPQYNHGAAWVDYDNDGYLDVFFSNYHQSRVHELYHNNGNGTFEKVTNAAMSLESARSLGPVWCDYDNDNFQDLFIPNNDNQNNSLYHNNGDGTFTKITSGAIVNDGGNSVGACWGDYDRDGDMDLYVANASGQNNFLYANNGDGTFEKITDNLVVSEGGHSHGCSWIDFDNDGDLDLYVTNDNGYKFLYINDGNGQFFRKLNEPIVHNFGNAFGQAWSDFDHDGDIDLYVSTHGHEPNKMFVNSGSGYNWVQINLQGSNSNKSAIGAKIRVKSSGFWQTTQVSRQCGFNGQHSEYVHFGVGSATLIDSIEVRWPSGIKQVWTNQAVNQFLAMTETNMATIFGVAYHDANSNCARDNEEQALAHMPLLINGGEYSVRTDANGHYALPLEDGVYEFIGATSNYWKSECLSFEQIVADNGNQHEVNIPFLPSAIGHDLSVALVGLDWERNSTKQTTLTYANRGTTHADATEIAVTYPIGVNIIDASIPWSYMEGQTYYWSLGSVPFGTSVTITMIDAISSQAAIGSTLSVHARIESSGNDLFSHNNTTHFDREIASQGSTNVIHVVPKGEGELGYIERDQELTYKIQFQNIGTHTANNIRIENTLPPNLDIQSLEIIAASNNYSYVITDDRHITIFFHGIDMTTATLSQLESQGVIMYRIKPLASAPAGEQIENKATMYFDYADPVTTNDVQNTLRGTSEGLTPNVMLWPNPTSDVIHIGLNYSQIQFEDRPTLELIEIADSKGQIVRSWKNTGLHQMDFHTIELRAGAYQVRVIDQRGQAHSGRFIVTRDER